MKKTLFAFVATAGMLAVSAQATNSEINSSKPCINCGDPAEEPGVTADRIPSKGSIEEESPYTYVGTRMPDGTMIMETPVQDAPKAVPMGHYVSCPPKKVVEIADVIFKKGKMFVKMPDGKKVKLHDPSGIYKQMPEILVSYQTITIVLDRKKNRWVVTKFDCVC